MKKSIAENCIRYISTATALILALAMLCCANFSAGAKTLGSNLTITDTTSLLEDINTTTNTTPAKTKDLIASGASVEVLTVGLSGFSNIYFIPSSNWLNESARFKLNLYIDGNYKSSKEMGLIDSTSHLYSASVDSSTNYSGFQFIRMDSSYNNQLDYSNTGISDSASKNLYTMTTSTNSGWTPDSNNGTWSTYEEKTIYFDNSKTNWGTVKVYCWDKNNNSVYNSAFPGDAMTKVDGTDNIYSYTYSTSYTNCIFNNGSNSNQTGNLTIQTNGKNLFSPTSSSDYGNDYNWKVYSTGTDPSNPVVTNADLLSVLNGENVMVYAGEKKSWEKNTYYFMTADGTTDNPAATVSLTIEREIKKPDNTIEVHKFGVATLSPTIQYYQGHWASGLQGSIVAGGTYIVRDKIEDSAFEQLAVNGGNYLYSYDANSSETTKTATTVIPDSITVGSKLSVNTLPQPGKSSLGKDNRFKYYLYDGTNYTEVSLTNGQVDTSVLPEGNKYQIITVLYDGNIYVRADADKFEIKKAQVNLADSVTLTSAPSTVEKNTALTLTATLNNKNTDAGNVKYTFTNESELSGTFGSNPSEVTTRDTSASVTFTPTKAGTYTFKVVASCDGYNQVENTVEVTVMDEVKYYITGRFMGKSWKDDYTDMQLTKDSDGIYKYATGKTVAELSAKIPEKDDNNKPYDPYFFIHTGKGSTEVWYGGSGNTGHEFNKNTDGTKFELTAQEKGAETGSSKLLKFADTTATTKQDVVICLDTRDSSHYKLWYEYTTPTEYSIEYTNNGKGTISGPTKALANETVQKSSFKITPNEGYELETLTFNDTTFTDRFTMPAQNVTVKATFKPTTYNITYRINNEVDDTLTPKTYTIESTEAERTLPVPPSRDGYTFSGWYSTYGVGDPVDVIPSGTTGNLNYYGAYEPIEYTVTFNPDGGSVTPTSQKVAYMSNYGTLPTPTKANYSFIGWYLDDVQITESSIYSTADNVTLKAKYAANPTISVKIMYNGVEDSSKATVTGAGEKEYNSSGTVTVKPKTGYYISSVTIETQSNYNYNVASGPWTYDYTNLKQNLTINVTLTDNPKVTVQVYYNDEIATDKATVTIGGVEQSESQIEYNGTASISVVSKQGYYISSVKLKDDTYFPNKSNWQRNISPVFSDITVKVYVSDNPKVVVKCVDARSGDEITDDSVSATVNSETSTDSGISVEYGSSVALVASVVTENSYQFNGFYKSDGTSLSTSASYTYENVTADTTILAKFDKLYEITIKWEKLDGLSLKIGEETTDLQNVSSPYKKYMTQGATFNLTTTINVKSEYKLNESCFVSSGLNGSYSVAREDEDKVTTKHYSCTVLASNGTITITPVPATYSGSGYWGDKVLKINVNNVWGNNANPYFTVEFSKTDETPIEARMVCINSTNHIYECPIPTGYTSFVLKRRNPDGGSTWNSSGSETIGDNTKYNSTGFKDGVIQLSLDNS